MKLLSLETASQPGSIALLENGEFRCGQELPSGVRTTQSFAVAIEQLLPRQRWVPRDIDVVAVSRGPGSFTGLRIGVTAAKMLAYALNCHVMGIGTLDVLAAQAGRAHAAVWAVLDAQRKQLFVQEFDTAVFPPRALTDVTIVDAQDWLGRLQPGSVVTGEGLSRWSGRVPTQAIVTDAACWRPTATALGKIASRRFTGGERQDLWQLAVDYHRPSAAEERRQSPG